MSKTAKNCSRQIESVRFSLNWSEPKINLMIIYGWAAAWEVEMNENDWEWALSRMPWVITAFDQKSWCSQRSLDIDITNLMIKTEKNCDVLNKKRCVKVWSRRNCDIFFWFLKLHLLHVTMCQSKVPISTFDDVSKHLFDCSILFDCVSFFISLSAFFFFKMYKFYSMRSFLGDFSFATHSICSQNLHLFFQTYCFFIAFSTTSQNGCSVNDSFSIQ